MRGPKAYLDGLCDDRLYFVGKRELKRYFSYLMAIEPPALASKPEMRARPQPDPPISAAPTPPALPGGSKALPLPAPPEVKPSNAIPPLPVVLEMDEAAFAQALRPRPAGFPEDYRLALQVHQLRLRETFDRLICLGTLNWKLANDLQKRFLLLLTATPVENNLMESFKPRPFV